MIVDQKLKVRGPLATSFLLEVEPRPAASTTRREEQQDQLVTAQRQKDNIYPDFASREDSLSGLVTISAGWELTYITVPAGTGNCLPWGACSWTLSILWFAA